MTATVGRSNSKAALVSAALEEFTEKGYEAATVNDIAERAGVTTGALYAHFPGKLHLALETLGLQPVEELVGPDLLGQLAGGAAVRFGHDMAQPPQPSTLLLLDVIVAARRDPQLASTIRRLLAAKIDQLVAVGEAARSAGLLSSDLDPDDLARVAAMIEFGKMAFAAIDADLPSDAAFLRLASVLLEEGGSPDGLHDDLSAVQACAVAARRAQLELEAAVRRAVGSGQSLRRVGAAAGASHEWVRRVAHG